MYRSKKLDASGQGKFHNSIFFWAFSFYFRDEAPLVKWPYCIFTCKVGGSVHVIFTPSFLTVLCERSGSSMQERDHIPKYFYERTHPLQHFRMENGGIVLQRNPREVYGLPLNFKSTFSRYVTIFIEKFFSSHLSFSLLYITKIYRLFR